MHQNPSSYNAISKKISTLGRGLGSMGLLVLILTGKCCKINKFTRFENVARFNFILPKCKDLGVAIDPQTLKKNKKNNKCL
jgi:hypothetical protein